MFNKRTRKNLKMFQKQADKKLKTWQKQANKLVDQLEPEKKIRVMSKQAEKLSGDVGDFISQLEPEKKIKELSKQAEKLSGDVSEFIAQLEPEKKIKELSKQAEKLSGNVGDFVTQLEPEKKLAMAKEQITKMMEKSSTDSPSVKNEILAPVTALALAETGSKALKNKNKSEKTAKMEKAEKPRRKKRHPIRNTLVLGSLATAGVAWNNRRLWQNVPTLESKLDGQEQRFNSRWGWVYYKETGNPMNPPLVLVHGIGAGASSYEWRRNFNALAKNFHVYAYDLLGFGKSERLPTVPYTAELYIYLLADFIRDVVKRPASVVAASLSAGHAMQVANRFPELISSMVLIQPSGIDAANGMGGANVTGSFSYPILRLPVIGQGLYSYIASRFSIRSFLQNQLYYDKTQVTYDMVEQYYIAAHQKGSEHAPVAFLAGKLNADIGSVAGNIKQPVMLVWGRQSKITPLEQAYKVLQQLPGAELKVLEDTRLACNDEKAEEFNQFTGEFLRRNKPPVDNKSFMTDISVARG